MGRTAIIAVIAWLAIGLISMPALADWPKSFEVGGFQITGITGSTNQDGSGRATGKLNLRGGGALPIDLSRTSAGVVTGSSRAGFTVGSIRIDGSFILDRRGLQGTGIIHTQGRPITDANITVSPRSAATARGRVRLAPGMDVNVTCEVGQQGAITRGSTNRQVSIDTPIAVYTFKGNIELSSAGTALAATAKGTIERKGKIGGVVSSFGPLTFNVEIATGKANLNIAGTNISLDLW